MKRGFVRSGPKRFEKRPSLLFKGKLHNREGWLQVPLTDAGGRPACGDDPVEQLRRDWLR